MSRIKCATFPIQNECKAEEWGKGPLSCVRIKWMTPEKHILFVYTGCLKENTADKYGHTKRRYN